MPTLLLDFAGERTHHPVGSGRVLIGRGEGSAIRIDHPAVSRFHASVEIIDGVPILRDAGSRNGVAVGHSLINQPHLLTDGERFTVGPAVITYFEGEPLESPPLLHKVLNGAVPAGQLLLCTCGAKLWVPLDMLGGRGQCPRCHHELDFPKPRPAAPPPTSNSTAPVAQTICSICQWTLSDGELVTCPSCGLTFHKECWIENKGCSAYGCNQVNVLEPREPQSATAGYESDDACRRLAAPRVRTADFPLAVRPARRQRRARPGRHDRLWTAAAALAGCVDRLSREEQNEIEPLDRIRRNRFERHGA